MSSFSYTAHRCIRTHTGTTRVEIGDKQEMEDRDEEFRGSFMKNCRNNLHFSTFPFIPPTYNDFWGSSLGTVTDTKGVWPQEQRKDRDLRFNFKL